MKKMTFLKFPLLILALSSMVLFHGCDEDKCKDVDCGANGVCVDGTCVCNTGYEGEKCDVEVRAKFLGTYTANDACSASGTSTYTVTITASSTDVTKVLIANAWNAFVNTVVATVDGNTITISNQEPDNDGFTIQGSGTISSDHKTITLNYTVTDTSTGASDVCQGTLTKQ